MLTSRECVRIPPSRCQSARRLTTTTASQSQTPWVTRDVGLRDLSPGHREGFVNVDSRNVLELAGDISVCNAAHHFVEGELEISPVVYVFGNHEYCGIQCREAVDTRWQPVSVERSYQHYRVTAEVTLRSWLCERRAQQEGRR